jgi:hypothetical protein
MTMVGTPLVTVPLFPPFRTTSSTTATTTTAMPAMTRIVFELISSLLNWRRGLPAPLFAAGSAAALLG